MNKNNIQNFKKNIVIFKPFIIKYLIEVFFQLRVIYIYKPDEYKIVIIDNYKALLLLYYIISKNIPASFSNSNSDILALNIAKL